MTGGPGGGSEFPDPQARLQRSMDVRSPRRTVWLASLSLLVVVPLVGWIEARAYAGAHGGPPPGLMALLLWSVGLTG